MNRKNVKIIINIFFIILAILLVFNINTVNAKQKIETNRIELGTDDATSSEKIGNEILGVIQVIGIILSVGVLMVLGIKYMLSSVQERAEKKKMFIYYAIGAFMVFGITNFADDIYNIVTEVIK